MKTLLGIALAANQVKVKVTVSKRDKQFLVSNFSFSKQILL